MTNTRSDFRYQIVLATEAIVKEDDRRAQRAAARETERQQASERIAVQLQRLREQQKPIADVIRARAAETASLLDAKGRTPRNAYGTPRVNLHGTTVPLWVLRVRREHYTDITTVIQHDGPFGYHRNQYSSAYNKSGVGLVCGTGELVHFEDQDKKLEDGLMRLNGEPLSDDQLVAGLGLGAGLLPEHQPAVAYWQSLFVSLASNELAGRHFQPTWTRV